MRRVRGGAIAIALWAVASAATAAPCAGFDDVEEADAFCTNVQWLRNRAVTMGCDWSSFCPGAPVTRLQMAAFMNRLGTVLTPRSYAAQSTLIDASFDLDAEPVFCETSYVPNVGYPRRAYVDVTLSAAAAADTTLALDIVHRTWSSSWSVVTVQPVKTTVPGGRWSAVTHLAQVDVAAGENPAFAAKVARGSVAGGDVLTSVNCELRAVFHDDDDPATP